MDSQSTFAQDLHEPRTLVWDPELSLRRSNKPVQMLWQFVSLVNELSHKELAGRLCSAHLFRGQRHPWPLVPKIARADRVEYQQHLEVTMLSELKRLSPLVMAAGQKPSTDLQWLSLAQHHGMATRLLDWTENALAALWFTVHEVEKWGDKDAPSVWVLTPDSGDIIDATEAEGLNPFEVKKTRIVCPDHFSERIRSQSGWFTLHHLDTEHGFVPLENQEDYRQKTADHIGKLGRIDIEPGFVGPLRRQLDHIGVSAATIFPDLDGLCQRITERVSRDYIPTR